MSNIHETIKNSIKKILDLMDFEAEYSIKEQIDPKSDKTVFICSITTQKNSRFLIGQHGSNLYALEHIIRSILYKNGHVEHINIDINKYKKDKDRMIKRLAKEAADQASKEKKPVVMRPMNAYERRIVHMTIADDDRVETESIGDKREERKVIVKPQSIMNSL